MSRPSARTRTHSLSHTLPLSHTHTHIRTHTHAYTHTHIGKLERLKQASDLHVTGLHHELELFRSRTASLESDNISLKDATVHADMLVRNLKMKVQALAEGGAFFFLLCYFGEYVGLFVQVSFGL